MRERRRNRLTKQEALEQLVVEDLIELEKAEERFKEIESAQRTKQGKKSKK